jgi:hypothetical protein
VPHNQVRGQIHSSAIDASLAFMDFVHKAWEQKLKVTALLFNILGFFNFVNHDGLIAHLQHYGFDDNTVSLIKSFISNQTTSLTFNNFTSDPLPI